MLKCACEPSLFAGRFYHCQRRTLKCALRGRYRETKGISAPALPVSSANWWSWTLHSQHAIFPLADCDMCIICLFFYECTRIQMLA